MCRELSTYYDFVVDVVKDIFDNDITIEPQEAMSNFHGVYTELSVDVSINIKTSLACRISLISFNESIQQ
jgi:hypothetical protein